MPMTLFFNIYNTKLKLLKYTYFCLFYLILLFILIFKIPPIPPNPTSQSLQSPNLISIRENLENKTSQFQPNRQLTYPDKCHITLIEK